MKIPADSLSRSATALFVGFGLRLLFFDFDLSIVGQAVRSRGHHAIASLHALHNLDLITLANSDFHRPLVSAIVGASEHHRSGPVFRGQQAGSRNDQRIGNRTRQHGKLDAGPRLEPLLGVFRLNPDLDRSAIGIERRADDCDFAFGRLLFAGRGDRRLVSELEQCRISAAECGRAR